jgi:hypothetical protein
LDLFFTQGLKPVFIRPALQAYLVNNSLDSKAATAPLDPFSFFNGRVFDYFQALQAGDLKKAESLGMEMSKLFPRQPYWLKQKISFRGMKTKASRQSGGM